MKSTSEILETNKRQKEFYNNIRQNFATRIWAGVRNGLLNKLRKRAGVSEKVYALHKEWMGDLSDKKVLDLGCFAGNYLSLYMAERAKSYVGIDLSDVAISKLSERLRHLPDAKALAVDFLSDEFQESQFDIIYAYGVLHHFPEASLLIERLKEKLAPEGIIISYDPLETSLPIKLMRVAYRPFQSDADWEWPFTRKTVASYRKAFKVVETRGILGIAKWLSLVNFLPLGEERLSRISRNWIEKDWQKSAVSDTALFRCMHITMLLKNKS